MKLMTFWTLAACSKKVKKRQDTNAIDYGLACYDIEEHHLRNLTISISTIFSFYLRFVSEGEIIDADPPADAILVSPTDFVKYVVRHLDELF